MVANSNNYGMSVNSLKEPRVLRGKHAISCGTGIVQLMESSVGPPPFSDPEGTRAGRSGPSSGIERDITVEGTVKWVGLGIISSCLNNLGKWFYI